MVGLAERIHNTYKHSHIHIYTHPLYPLYIHTTSTYLRIQNFPKPTQTPRNIRHHRVGSEAPEGIDGSLAHGGNLDAHEGAQLVAVHEVVDEAVIDAAYERGGRGGGGSVCIYTGM